MSSELATRYESLLARSGTATIVAVSKYQTDEAVIEAYEAGVRDFGENYIDDLEKRRQLDLPGIIWHYVGAIQRNKLKRIVEAADVIQSVDRIQLFEAIPPEKPIYIQINLSGEENRPGCSWDDTPSLVDAAKRQGVTLSGLMGVAPVNNNPEDSRPYFRRLAQVARDLEVSGLSMGMSDDFEIAIEEGSTMVRIGTALFGQRTRPHAPQ